MLREPYNVNPYNSTIDTSKANNYGFTFSGDELGSFKIQIAKNNSSPEIVYTSKEFLPTDVGYENIYDGDMVEGIALPSPIATSKETGKAELKRYYHISRIGRWDPEIYSKISCGHLESPEEFVPEYTFTDILCFEEEGSYQTYVVTTDLIKDNSNYTCRLYDLAGNPRTTKANCIVTFKGYCFTAQGEDNIYTVRDDTEEPPIQGTQIEINKQNFEVIQKLQEKDPITGYFRLRLSSDSNVTQLGSVDYISYNIDETTEPYLNTKGQDLLWRAQLFEPGNPPAVQNFLRQGAFYGTTTLGSSSTPLYEGDINLAILDNFSNKRSSIVRKVQIGDDMFLETINSATQMTVTIMPQLNYSSLNTDMQAFTTLLNTNYTTIIIDIDKNTFSLANGSAAVLSSDNSYITLTLNGDTSKLQPKLYYNYFIEFRNDQITTNIINGIVTKTTVLKADEDPFTYTFKTQNLSESPIGFTFYEYSNGDQRIFYNFNKTLTGLTSFPVPYRLYSDGINSNWYFFQSRETPVLTLQAKPSNGDWQDFPLTVTTRKIKYKGTYSQADGIGVRYHKWKIADSEGNTVFQTDEIYNSDFTLNREILDADGTYIVTLTIVNQAGVETSISGSIIANIAITEIQAACNAEVNDEEHTVEITWLNGLGAEPEEEADPDAFGNRISVGKTGQDYQLNSGQLTYSTVSGGPIAVERDNLVTRLGLVINDDAKVGTNNNEFYDSTFFVLNSTSNPVKFNKRGLDVAIDNRSRWFRLLEDTDGQVSAAVHTWTNYYLGKNYIWDENNSNTWRDGDYWAETKSDTNCYFYQIGVQNNNAIAYRIPYQRVSASQLRGLTNTSLTDGEGISVDFNPLFGTDTEISVKVRIDDGIEGTEKTSYDATLSPNENKTQSTLRITQENVTLNFTPQEIVIYKPFTSGSSPIGASTSIGVSEADYTGFILGPKTNLFYFTVWDGEPTSPEQLPSFPFELGEKPTWENQSTMLINVKFNGSLLSSRLEDMETSVSGYQVYRRRWDLIGSDGTEPIYSAEPIYTRLVGTFDLADEDLTTSPKFKFIDWTVENRGIFDYVIVPIPEDGVVSQEANIISNQKVTTDWYGWSFTSFDKFPTGHFEPLERWLFKLNIQTNGYTHQTNKVFHQGFNRYPKVSIGMTNYITTNLSCLIGEINKELKRSYWHKEKQGYTRDSIITIEKWEDFSNRSDLVLIKDYKGRVFIGTIDGNIMSFEDVIAEILTTLSFNVTQIDSDTNYQIFSIEGE